MGCCCISHVEKMDICVYYTFLSYCQVFLTPPGCLQLILVMGAKLQHIIVTLAMESSGVTELITGTKSRPRDELFWFKKPELLLSLIHFTLFQV